MWYFDCYAYFRQKFVNILGMKILFKTVCLLLSHTQHIILYLNSQINKQIQFFVDNMLTVC